MNEKPNSLGGGALHPRVNRKASSSRGASFNLDSFIDMVNDHDCQVANVDMAIQTQWFDDGVIFKLFSEIDNENTLDMISKRILAFYNYYLSYEDGHLGMKDENGIFKSHRSDFPQWLKQVKKRTIAQRSAYENLNNSQNELLEYLNQGKNATDEGETPLSISTMMEDGVLLIPQDIQKMMSLSLIHHANDFAKIVHEDICKWIKENKSQYWDLVYIVLLDLGLLKVGTTRKGFSRLIEHFTFMKRDIIYHNMMKNYSHGKSVEWYRKQPDSSEAQMVGREIKKMFLTLV